MDQTRTGGAAGEQPRGAASGEEPAAKRVIIGDDVPPAAAASAGFGCFDCNICLECATEPVVTLCGHLYCWPCIYEWLRPGTDAEAEDAMSSMSTRRQCPVCKAAVSPDALVPLYGRGLGKKPPPPPRAGGLPSTVPPRRPALRRQSAQGIGNGNGNGNGGHQHRNFLNDAPARTPRQLDGAVLPTAFGDRGGGGMMQSTSTAGGMAVAVLPWVLRGQGPPPGIYYSGSYDLTNARQRRWHMELERSLHQLWFFLFVFVVLCLLLF